MNIARREARETPDWLRRLRDTEALPTGRLASIVRESDEIVRILVAIVKSTRSAEHAERHETPHD